MSQYVMTVIGFRNQRHVFQQYVGQTKKEELIFWLKSLGFTQKEPNDDTFWILEGKYYVLVGPQSIHIPVDSVNAIICPLPVPDSISIKSRA